jgi:hypothetical protein
LLTLENLNMPSSIHPNIFTCLPNSPLKCNRYSKNSLYFRSHNNEAPINNDQRDLSDITVRKVVGKTITEVKENLIDAWRNPRLGDRFQVGMRAIKMKLPILVFGITIVSLAAVPIALVATPIAGCGAFSPIASYAFYAFTMGFFTHSSKLEERKKNDFIF